MKNQSTNGTTHNKPSMLLHICCAPDAVYIAPKLNTQYRVTMFFYNPNIHPKKEYELRVREIKFVAQKFRLPLIVGPYNVRDWLEYVKEYRFEPEGGKRCELCFEQRLEVAATKAKELGLEYLTTVLTVSPHKKADVINRIGEKIAEKHNLKWLYSDFKKKNGFLYSLRISKYLNLYRQNYCGCAFSLKERLEKEARKKTTTASVNAKPESPFQPRKK